MISFLKTRNTLEIIVNGCAYSVDKSNPSFDKIVNAIRTKESEDNLIKMLDIAKTLTAADARVVVEGGQVTYAGEVLHGTMIERIFELADLQLDAKAVINFVERLMRNPDRVTVGDLYDFLEVGKLPLTEDGFFLAYKVVRADYKDKHSGTMDNSVGKIVEMPRSGVNKNRDQTCSSGLHFCSFEYIKHFLGGYGDRIVLVKVDPADVVSIPSDYNNTKARCCRYEVVKDVTEEMFPTKKPVPGTTSTYVKDTGNDILRDKKVAGWQDKVVETVAAPIAPKVEEKHVDNDVCPHCGSRHTVERQGYDTSSGHKRRRKCNGCGKTYSFPGQKVAALNLVQKRTSFPAAKTPAVKKPVKKKLECGTCGSDNVVGVVGQNGVLFCKDCHSIT